VRGVYVAYKINTKKCLRCGLCIKGCPEGAIVDVKREVEFDGLVRYTTRIDPKKCTDCGVCVSFEWWCPAQAIAKAT
jgi:ferredoxin